MGDPGLLLVLRVRAERGARAAGGGAGAPGHRLPRHGPRAHRGTTTTTAGGGPRAGDLSQGPARGSL